MKSASFFLLVFLLGIFTGPLCGQSVTGDITQIDQPTSSFTIAGAKGAFHQFKVKLTTEITINGERGALKDLALGKKVQVTPGETGFAARIISPPPGTFSKVAPTQSLVKVPATSVNTNPVVVGSVKAGQVVTVTPKKVWWTGGGTHKGKYTDWRGYDPDKVKKGVPWMALVAAVGKDEHWAKDNTLSFTVPEDGNLVLYASDGDAGGNIGDGEVTVTVGAAAAK